jgi:Family of unknown function (DUF6843)/Carboxypeptidase regulatory-like domain
MKHNPTRFPAALAAYLFLVAAASPQTSGIISGTVTDEQGAPIAKAKVNAEPANDRPTSTLVRFVETNQHGHFVIDKLAWGKYRVFAQKVEAGYPDMGASFYSNDVYPTAYITPEAPSAEIRIRLGPKAGTLTGSVTSALTGAPVYASFRLAQAAPPHKWLITGLRPKYRILLPSSTNVLLEVFAPGFEPWSPNGPIRLQPGEVTRLDIALEPSHDPNLHPSKFLVPQGYVGWLLLDYGVKEAKPAPSENGYKVFKFPVSGALSTSSPGPERGADDEYFYYSADDSLSKIPTDYRRGKGMIWGQHQASRNGIMSEFGFFIGTEEQYKKFQILMTHPGPVPTQ